MRQRQRALLYRRRRGSLVGAEASESRNGKRVCVSEKSAAVAETSEPGGRGS